MSNILQQYESLLDSHPKRLTWDEYHMLEALGAKARSPDRRLKVGCVLVKDRRTVATGYNGYLAGAPHKQKLDNRGHEQHTVHAEQNAVADCARRGVSTVNCTAYITHFPCINCAKILAAAGISCVKYLHDYRNNPDAVYILRQAHVWVAKLGVDETSSDEKLETESDTEDNVVEVVPDELLEPLLPKEKSDSLFR